MHYLFSSLLILIIFLNSHAQRDNNQHSSEQFVDLVETIKDSTQSAQKRIDAATQLLVKAEGRPEASILALTGRAACYFQLGKNERATEDLEKAKELLPEATDESKLTYHMLLGAQLINAGQLTKGEKELTQAIEIAQKLGDEDKELHAICYLGFAARYQGMHLQAKSYFEYGIEVAEKCKVPSENLFALQLNRAQCCVALGLVDEAKNILKEVSENEKSLTGVNRVRFQKVSAELDIELKNYDVAESRLKKILETLRPEFECGLPEAYEALTRLYLAKGDNQLATEMIENIENHSIESTVANNVLTANGLNRISCYLGQLNFEEAIAECEKLLNTDSIDIESELNVLEMKLCCLLAMENYEPVSKTIMLVTSKRELLEKKRGAYALGIARQVNSHREKIKKLEQESIRQELEQVEKKSWNRLISVGTVATLASLLLAILAWAFNVQKGSAVKEKNVQKVLREQELRFNQKLQAKLDDKVVELEDQKTKQLQLQSELNRKQRDQTIGQLTSGVAHDFNNLLMVVANANSMIDIVLGDELPDDAKRVIETSNAAVDTASEITRRLMMFAKKSELNPSSITVSELLKECTPLIRQTLGENIELIVEDTAPDFQIVVDKASMITAMINVASNSRMAISHYGTFCISTEIRRWNDYQREMEDENADCIFSRASRTSDQLLKIAFVDNGVGMPKEEISKICDPFYTTRESSGGSGLGLSVVKGFLENSMAGFEICSRPAAGTTVAMYFPESNNYVSKAVGEAGFSAGDFTDIHVLLVDDHELIRQSTGVLLTQLGMRVSEAQSGTEAKRLLQQGRKFDIVVTDVKMADPIDGIALANWIFQSNPDLPVMLISGFHDVETNLKVLQKPFTSEQLLQAMSQSFKDHKIHSEA